MSAATPTARLEAAVHDFLDAEWDPDITLGAWWSRLARVGWSVPTWPKEWGGAGLSLSDAAVVRRVLEQRGAAAGPAGLGVMLAGPTVMAHGDDAHKQRFLPEIIDGTANWCQLFSEPAAGSDLASLTTRARRDGDRWIVTGQKVWTSNAHLADIGMLLARTDATTSGREGLTWFALDMDQPGAIELRPLREMTGRSLFFEVFLDGAVVDHECAVGGAGNGWAVARTTLANERAGLSGGAVGPAPGKRAGASTQRAGDAARRRARRSTPTGTSMAMRGRAFDALWDAARRTAVDTSPAVRAALAELAALERLTTLFQRTALARGRGAAADASIGKLLHSRQVRSSGRAASAISGAVGMLVGPEALGEGSLSELVLFIPAVSIYGGTDEIQRNVLAERILGLPRERAASAPSEGAVG